MARPVQEKAGRHRNGVTRVSGIGMRLGWFRYVQGPELFFIIPIVESVPYGIDVRVITSAFKAGKTLTRDTVPVDVHAALFWKVVDPAEAALDGVDCNSAISWVAQTALRDMIGRTLPANMLEGREKIGGELQKIIGVRTEPRGINAIPVEVEDVLIPAGLEDAMSMQAQAERERQARVILGDSERQISEKFSEAVQAHRSAMNMLLYEGLKQNATLAIVSSIDAESMQLGGIAEVSALNQEPGQRKGGVGWPPGPELDPDQDIMRSRL